MLHPSRRLRTILCGILSVFAVTTVSAQVTAPPTAPPAQNNPPYFTSTISAQTVNLGDLVTVTLQAKDDESDPFNFAIAAVPGGAPFPPGARIINGNTFQWQPTAVNTAGTAHFAVRFRAVDPVHNQESHQDVDYFIGTAQSPPVFTTSPINTHVEEGTPFKVTVQAYDPNAADRPNLVFSLNGEPIGAAIDPKNGVLTWTPPYTLVSGGGTRLITFISLVGDAVPGNAPASLPISLTVADVTVVQIAPWNRGVCQVGGALSALDRMANTYARAASNRRRAKSGFGLAAAVIAALTPFSDKVGGSDLPLGFGIGAAIIGVITERLPDPGPRERQTAVLHRAHGDLRSHELRFTRTATDVRDPEQLQIRTDALNANERAGKDLQAVGLTISPASCP